MCDDFSLHSKNAAGLQASGTTLQSYLPLEVRVEEQNNRIEILERAVALQATYKDEIAEAGAAQIKELQLHIRSLSRHIDELQQAILKNLPGSASLIKH